jgi:pullulanase/glycogen debranching enzyme
MDVVYNHLYSSGPSAITSVLDKVALVFSYILFFFFSKSFQVRNYRLMFILNTHQSPISSVELNAI